MKKREKFNYILISIFLILLLVGFVTPYGRLINPDTDTTNHSLLDATSLLWSNSGHTIDIDFMPDTTLSYDIGSWALRWGNLFVSDISADNISAFNIEVTGDITSPFGNFSSLVVGDVNLSELDEIYLNLSGTNANQNINISPYSLLAKGIILDDHTCLDFGTRATSICESGTNDIDIKSDGRIDIWTDTEISFRVDGDVNDYFHIETNDNVPTLRSYLSNMRLWADEGLITVTGNLSAIGYNISASNYFIGPDLLNSSHIIDHATNGEFHSIKDAFNHIFNRGISEEITVSLTGGLNVEWTAGEIYDSSIEDFVEIDAGSGTLVSDQVNYLKYTGTSTLELQTSSSSDDEILVARFANWDNIIAGKREISVLDNLLSDISRGLRIAFPNRIISGMSVSEDIDATNDLDVSMDAGKMVKDGINEVNPTAIDSRTLPLVRLFHSGGDWTNDTDAEIDTLQYDDGNNLVNIPAHKYVKAYFIYMPNKLGWVYPTTYYNTKAQAEEGALSPMPEGLLLAPKLTTVIYQQGDTDFSNAEWQDIRPGISEESFKVVSDHGSLAGLSDDDHPQYLLADGTRNLTGLWNYGSEGINGSGFIKTTGTVFAGAIDFGVNQMTDGFIIGDWDFNDGSISNVGYLSVDELNFNNNVISSTTIVDFDSNIIVTSADASNLIRTSATGSAFKNGLSLKHVTGSATIDDTMGISFFLAVGDSGATNNIVKFGAYRDGADNSGRAVITTRKEGAWSDGLTIDSDNSVYFPFAYDDTNSSANVRDLWIQEDGQLVYISSSRDYKKNIVEAENTDFIYDLPIVDFDYIDGLTSQTGGIAEDWDLVDNRLISYKRNITYKIVCEDVYDYTDEKGKQITHEECTNKIDKIETTDIPETINYGSPILITSMLKEMQIMKQENEAKDLIIEQMKQSLCKLGEEMWCIGGIET